MIIVALLIAMFFGFAIAVIIYCADLALYARRNKQLEDELRRMYRLHGWPRFPIIVNKEKKNE